MNRLTTFIAEDEELARTKLREALLSRADLSLVGEAPNGETAVREIERLRPQLLLLDVQMPGMNGFEVVRALSYTPQVIFTTAYDQYAIKAFEVHSLDYLLKPYSRERLYEAIDRALEIDSHSSPQFAQQIAALLKDVRAPERLACQKKGEIYFVAPTEVVWFEAVDTLTFVHTAGDRLRINRTLNELETELEPAGFIRAHRAALVNLKFVRKLTPRFNGSYEITVEHCPQPLPLSRRQGQKVKQRFGW
jgi:two-component system LytT family response regulator